MFFILKNFDKKSLVLEQLKGQKIFVFSSTSNVYIKNDPVKTDDTVMAIENFCWLFDAFVLTGTTVYIFKGHISKTLLTCLILWGIQKKTANIIQLHDSGSPSIDMMAMSKPSIHSGDGFCVPAINVFCQKMCISMPEKTADIFVEA